MIELHTPFSSRNSGSTNTQMIWNTSVRANEITADTSPLFSAVKNAEPKMLKPQIR